MKLINGKEGKSEIADETPQVEKKNQFQDNLKKNECINIQINTTVCDEENRGGKKLTQKISINSRRLRTFDCCERLEEKNKHQSCFENDDGAARNECKDRS